MSLLPVYDVFMNMFSLHDAHVYIYIIMYMYDRCICISMSCIYDICMFCICLYVLHMCVYVYVHVCKIRYMCGGQKLTSDVDLYFPSCL